MLGSSASIEEREKYKNSAVEVRESGKLDQARNMFVEIIEWDKTNNNPRGQMDVLGHLKIVFTRLAETEPKSEAKLDWYNKALETSMQSLAIGEENPQIPEGVKAIQKIHAASLILDLCPYQTSGKEEKLNEALKMINEAIATLPGSEAHKAWPSNTKAKILFELGKDDEAVEVLTQAQTFLYKGYEDEIKNDDQAEIKLNVWLAGIQLTYANICAKTGKNILAKQYASAVLNIEDPKNVLNERKKEAQKILDSLISD